MADILLIPNGPKNLQSLFPGVNFNDIENYFIEILGDTGEVIATTTLMNLIRCADLSVRIHFLNNLGTIDAIDFKIQNIEHNTKSEKYQIQTSYPAQAETHSITRYNVRSNDVIQAVLIEHDESRRDWMDELFDSPMAWIEDDNRLLPIVIIDKSRKKIQETDRYNYEIVLEFTLSNDKNIIRN